MVKQKESASQWYTIQYTSFPNKSRNIWFTKYSQLSVGTLHITPSHFVVKLAQLESVYEQYVDLTSLISKSGALSFLFKTLR